VSLDQIPEAAIVTADAQVRQLVDHDSIEDEGRRKHEPPAEGE
jgi:hypothetical protein